MNDSDNGDSNIYHGLPEFRYDETLDKLHATIAKLEAENGELQRKLDSMKKDKESLESNFKILSTNLSSLLKTARIEVSRKDRTIDDLRKQLSEVLPNRKRISTKWKNDDVVDVPSRKRHCPESERTTYYSRKPEFHVEDVAKEASKAAASIDKPKLPERKAESDPPTPRSAVREVDSWPSNGEKPLPKDVPFIEDGNCRPPPLNCPTVFSARMYRRMYNCSTGVAPDPPAEIPFASEPIVEVCKKRDINARLSPLLRNELAAELPPARSGDLPSIASRTEIIPPKSGTPMVQSAIGPGKQNCLNVGDRNSDAINILAQPCTSSNNTCSLETNVSPFSKVENRPPPSLVGELGRSQSELTFKVDNQPAEKLVNEQNMNSSPNSPKPLSACEDQCHFDVKADLRLSDSECSMSNSTPAVSDSVIFSNESSDRPVSKKPENAKSVKPLRDKQLEGVKRGKIAKANAKLKKSSNCSQKSAAKNSPSVRSNAKLKFTPISTSWVCSVSSKDGELPEESLPSRPSAELQKDGLPEIPVTSELKVTIEEPLVNQTTEELLFGSPVKWTEDSCDSAKKDDQQSLKVRQICSIFGSPLKNVDSGSSDRLNFSVPQNAYEESCWTSQSLQLKDSKPPKASPSAQESNVASEERGASSDPSAALKSIFSPSKDSESFHRPITGKMGDRAESLTGLSFPFKSAPKYGDSVLGHYDDTAQFVSALAKDETELSPLSTPSKSHNVSSVAPSNDPVPSSFKEIFVNNGKANEIIQPPAPVQDIPAASGDKSIENCPTNVSNEPVETNVRGGVIDQALSSLSSINSLPPSFKARMITPPNLASSSLLSPKQSPSNAPINRLEPRKTPRIVDRSGGATLKKVESDNRKVALNDDFVAQQEIRWGNCKSVKKSSGRNSGSPSPKKGHKTTISPVVSGGERQASADSHLKLVNEVVPALVDAIKCQLSVEKVSSSEVVKKECENIDPAISAAQVSNSEEFSVSTEKTPEDQNSDEKSIPNRENESAVCASPKNTGSTLLDQAGAHDPILPQQQIADATELHKEPSNEPKENISDTGLLVAKKEEASSVLSPHRVEDSVKKTGASVKPARCTSAANRKKHHNQPRGHIKVLMSSKDSNIVTRVESPGQLNGKRESRILKPVVSSVNASGKIIIRKPVSRRNKDFKKSSALKNAALKRSSKLADSSGEKCVEDVSQAKVTSPPKLSMETQGMSESNDCSKNRVPPARRKSDPELNSKALAREEDSPRFPGGSRLGWPKLSFVRRKSGNDLCSGSKGEGFGKYPSPTPHRRSNSPTVSAGASKRETKSSGSSFPARSAPWGKRECKFEPKTNGLESFSVLVSKTPKRLWRKSETNFTSVSRSIEIRHVRSDEETPPRGAIFRRKSSDCNFSSVTRETVSIERNPRSGTEQVFNGSFHPKPRQPAGWSPLRIDLDTVENIYHCIRSSFSPVDPRACRELSKGKKPVVHVCGVDWNPGGEETLVSSAPLVAESPKSSDLDLSAISPTRTDVAARSAITVATSTPVNRIWDKNLQKSPFASRRKPFVHLNAGEPPANIRSKPILENLLRPRMVTRNRGRSTIMLSSPLEMRKSQRRRRSSPESSGSPNENLSARPEEVKKTRKNLTDQPKSSKSAEPSASTKLPKSAKPLVNTDAEDVPGLKNVRTLPTAVGNPPKPKLISLKPRNANFSSLPAASTSSNVIYVGRNESSFRSSD